MKQKFAVVFAALMLAWSFQASAIVHTLDVSIAGEVAKTISYVYSPGSERFTYYEVQCFGTLYEESIDVDTKYDETERFGTEAISCGAYPLDTSLTQSCAYCNDTQPAQSGGATWVSAGHWLFPEFHLFYVEDWRRDTDVNGRVCRVYLGGGGY